MLEPEKRFIILRVNTRAPSRTRDILLKIQSKNDLVNALVRNEIVYYKVDSTKYSIFIHDMKKNPFIRGHIKHINIYSLYS